MYGWYKKHEIETIINYNLGNKFEVFVSTAQPAVMRAMEKVGVKPKTESKFNGRLANRTYILDGRKHRVTISGGWFRIGDRSKKSKAARKRALARQKKSRRTGR